MIYAHKLEIQQHKFQIDVLIIEFLKPQKRTPPKATCVRLYRVITKSRAVAKTGKT